MNSKSIGRLEHLPHLQFFLPAGKTSMIWRAESQYGLMPESVGLSSEFLILESFFSCLAAVEMDWACGKQCLRKQDVQAVYGWDIEHSNSHCTNIRVQCPKFWGGQLFPLISDFVVGVKNNLHVCSLAVNQPTLCVCLGFSCFLCFFFFTSDCGPQGLIAISFHHRSEAKDLWISPAPTLKQSWHNTFKSPIPPVPRGTCSWSHSNSLGAWHDSS